MSRFLNSFFRNLGFTVCISSGLGCGIGLLVLLFIQIDLKNWWAVSCIVVALVLMVNLIVTIFANLAEKLD